MEVSQNGAVLVTGASNGIGRAVALTLGKTGYCVYAGVRKEADMQGLQAKNIFPILLDVTNPVHIQNFTALLREELATTGLSAVINNAGIAIGGPLEFIPIHLIRQQMEVNYVGAVAITQACMDLLRQAQGRIIFVGSLAGRVSSPFLTPYSASKFALEALADALRIELYPWNIRVVMVTVGAVNTPIWSKSLDTFDRMSQSFPQQAFDLYHWIIPSMRSAIANTSIERTPEEVGQLILQIMTAKNPKARYRFGRDAAPQELLRLLPAPLLDWIIWHKLPKEA